MTVTTSQDAIKAATSVARDVAEGRLSPAALQEQAARELRELLGTVTGPDDPLWPLQLEVCRGVLAAGGLDLHEQAEWLGAARQRAAAAPTDAAD